MAVWQTTEGTGPQIPEEQTWCQTCNMCVCWGVGRETLIRPVADSKPAAGRLTSLKRQTNGFYNHECYGLILVDF